MNYLKKIEYLLHSNSSENNLLAFQLLKSQLNYSEEEALNYVIKHIIKEYEIVKFKEFIPLGNLNIVFLLHNRPPVIQFGDGSVVLEFVIVQDEKEILKIGVKDLILENGMIKDINLEYYKRFIIDNIYLVVSDVIGMLVKSQ